MWSLGNFELTDLWWISVSLMRFDPMLNSGLSLKSSNEVASMFRKSLAVCISLAFAVSLAAAGGETPSQVKLSAAAIVELRFLFQFRAKSPAGSHSLHDRPRRFNCRLSWN